MRRIAATLGVAALLATSGSAARPARVAQAGAPAPSHCAAGERMVWSCRFGAKLGSICLDRSTLHYRFGTAGHAAIDVSSAPDWSNIHTGSNRSQGGLNQNSIRFTREAVHYVVHAGATGSLNENPGRRFSGITVLEGANGEKQLAEIACRSGAGFAEGALDAMQAAAPRQWQGDETPDGPFDMVY